MNRRAATALAALFLLAVALRVVAIDHTNATAAPAEENRLIARNLAAGRGFTFTEFGVTGPTAIRGPAYPMMLAWVGPDHVKLILAINVLAGAATVLAAFALTRRLTVLSPLPCTHGRGLGRGSAKPLVNSRSADTLPNPLPEYRARGQELRPAIIAAALFAIWPTQVYAATLTQGLSIAVLLTLAALALAFRRTPGATIAAGALAGLAALTEPVLALPLLFAAVAIGWRKSDGRSAWPQAAVFVAVGCVTVAPWLYRNAIVFGRPMPITSNFWRDAFLGNGPRATGSQLIDFRAKRADQEASQATRLNRLPAAEYDSLKIPEPARVSLYRAASIDWITQHPRDYLRLCGRRLSNTLLVPFHPNSRTFSYLYIQTALVVTAGWIMSPRFRGPARTTAVLMSVGLIVPAVTVLAEARLMVLLDVPLLIAAAYTTATLNRPKRAK